MVAETAGDLLDPTAVREGPGRGPVGSALMAVGVARLGSALPKWTGADARIIPMVNTEGFE